MKSAREAAPMRAHVMELGKAAWGDGLGDCRSRAEMSCRARPDQ